jgi:hypothetical protein
MVKWSSESKQRSFSSLSQLDEDRARIEIGPDDPICGNNAPITTGCVTYYISNNVNQLLMAEP